MTRIDPCPICGATRRACGDDHVRALITADTIKGDQAMEPLELKEYEYMVGHVPVTAMLTEAQARRLNAVEPGTAASPGEGNVVNNEADRHATQTRAGEDQGVVSDDSQSAAEKTRTARNKRAQ